MLSDLSRHLVSQTSEREVLRNLQLKNFNANNRGHIFRRYVRKLTGVVWTPFWICLSIVLRMGSCKNHWEKLKKVMRTVSGQIFQSAVENSFGAAWTVVWNSGKTNCGLTT